MSIQKTTRRKFLTSSLGGAAALGASYRLPVWAKPLGANGDVRIAIIGCGGKGGDHIGHILGTAGTRIAALADPDETHTSDNAKRIAGKQGTEPKVYKDYRELCQDPDVDAVIIATPNHLHSTIAIFAAAHGKHVYVEKPVSHNIWEGRKLVEASEKYGKDGLIIHHGMQRRSDQGWWEILEWIKDEPLGKMTLSRGLCYKPRQSIGKVAGPQQPPPGVDYDLWSGPREMLPIMRQRFHYDWHWQWPYGNGDIGNQGPHQMDVARWVTGQEALPTSVLSIGGRFGYDDDATTANTQIAFFDYKPVPIIFEVRGLPRTDMDWGKGMPAYKGGQVGNVVHFEGGYITESKAYDNDGKTVKKFPVTDGAGHFENWIASVRSGKHDARWSAHTGHVSAALCHMANISYRVGKPTTDTDITANLKDDANALETYERMRQHLADNKVDVKMDLPTLGGHLTMNPKTERFEGNLADEANAHVKEDYRAGFEIPEQV